MREAAGVGGSMRPGAEEEAGVGDGGGMRPGAEEEARIGDGSGMRPGAEEEAGVAVGAWVEEEVPASSSLSSTSSIESSAIIRFLEIIILARMNYSHYSHVDAAYRFYRSKCEEESIKRCGKAHEKQKQKRKHERLVRVSLLYITIALVNGKTWHFLNHLWL